MADSSYRSVQLTMFLLPSFLPSPVFFAPAGGKSWKRSWAKVIKARFVLNGLFGIVPRLYTKHVG